MKKNSTEKTYHVRGMHCPSCEILIEKKLRDLKQINSAKASVAKGTVVVDYRGDTPAPKFLDDIFEKDGYTFSDQPEKVSSDKKISNLSTPVLIGLIFIALFIGLNKFGLTGLVNVSSGSSLPTFFLFGLIAGISTCAALVGGIILAMSKQWNNLYSTTGSTWDKIQPHLIFNTGRLISYGVFGAVLGAIGSKLNFSLNFGPFFVLAVSLFMIVLSFQMLGIRWFERFTIRLPRVFTGFATDESNFKGRFMPFTMGALTFFLPCGFTITAQGLALLSGSALQGALIMLVFALGTLPVLLAIGFSSVKISQKPKLSETFTTVAGILVLFFALFNINSQLNVLGLASLKDIGSVSGIFASNKKNDSLRTNKNLPPLSNGKQVIKMVATSAGYSPDRFVVQAGIPVRWEITDKGTSGCTNAVISRSLFSGDIPLKPGTTSVKEFTPRKSGTYKFSCWMGMVSGVIEVVDGESSISEDTSSKNGVINREEQPTSIPCGPNGTCSFDFGSN